MLTIHSISEMRDALLTCRHKQQEISLVPTMGGLHQGHLDLVLAAKKQSDITVVSIFVNPLQFSGGDFDAYPRNLKQDAKLLQSVSTDIVFAPSAAEMYPRKSKDLTNVLVPAMSNILCGAHREGHFTGVATVVTKLFNIVQPHKAFFGEKDYQQLQIIKLMIADLNMPIHIQGVKTTRESDGLAMSSRNQYLDAAQREIAATLYRELENIRQRVLQSDDKFLDIENNACQNLRAIGMKPDYVEIRDSNTLAVGDVNSKQLHVLAAAWLGKARLIDNIRIR